ELFRSLGIERAHVVASTSWDWAGLVASHPEVIASLTLVSPGGLDVDLLRPIASKLLVIGGEGDGVARLAASPAMPGAVGREIEGYVGLPWADPARDHTDVMCAGILDHVHATAGGTPPLSVDASEGEVAGITYSIEGHGPPLVLIPLMLAPSQWAPLIPRLRERYTTITLGGQELGFVPLLEDRARTTGYTRLVGSMLDAAGLAPTDDLLEVGCGPGSLLRWMVASERVRRVVGVDINDYLLGEARRQADLEGLGDAIDLRQGNAESLPFPDARFDVTFSSTVMEEGDADLMLGEMIRVTRPGGKVVVIVRSVDIPWVVNAGLPLEVKARVEAPGGGVAKRGCADSSLYRRFRDAGLRGTLMAPQFLPMQAGDGRGVLLRRVLEGMASVLDRDDAAVFADAVDEARNAGLLSVAWPHHCAVGSKPE
ncbi:methyltransferase domain-containing protein, partial [Candidatus Poribacteria bacterium]|nr:methyltransferase domain-containing protein [Candidatus Poribacteria bacterium]